MKQIAKVLVGSRLHGLHTESSDFDYRGIHIHSLQDKLSPFKKLKNTSWIEGDEDNTSYELSDFCKQAVHGNATILEVFFSDEIIETSPIHSELRANWKKFIDTKRFVAASRGYAHNQWNKFYNFEERGELEGTPRDIGKLLKEVYTDIEEEEQENIKDQLYSIFKSDIMKYATHGLAQWYKTKLVEGSINGTNGEAEAEARVQSEIPRKKSGSDTQAVTPG